MESIYSVAKDTILYDPVCAHEHFELKKEQKKCSQRLVHHPRICSPAQNILPHCHSFFHLPRIVRDSSESLQNILEAYRAQCLMTLPDSREFRRLLPFTSPLPFCFFPFPVLTSVSVALVVLLPRASGESLTILVLFPPPPLFFAPPGLFPPFFMLVLILPDDRLSQPERAVLCVPV